MHYDHINVPADGAPITANPNHSLNVPDCPIIPFIEGDGIGIGVTPVMLDVVNAAVEKAYGSERQMLTAASVRSGGCRFTRVKKR